VTSEDVPTIPARPFYLIVAYLTMSSSARAKEHQMAESLVNNDLENMWNEAILA
jgi:hypothetical protein